jgi:hypothetical protein
MQILNDRLVLFVSHQLQANSLLTSRGFGAAWPFLFPIHFSLFAAS